MKFFYLLVICALSMAAMTSAQHKFNFPEQKPNLPELYGGGGGSRSQGFDVNINAKQKVWESDNGRHSVDLHAGHAQHLGGPYGSGPADRKIGAGYTFRF